VLRTRDEYEQLYGLYRESDISATLLPLEIEGERETETETERQRRGEGGSRVRRTGRQRHGNREPEKQSGGQTDR